jgi:hypothetical protein
MGNPRRKKQQKKKEEAMAEDTYLWFSCGKVRLDKDLADTNVLAHITHSLFHGLPCS